MQLVRIHFQPFLVPYEKTDHGFYDYPSDVPELYWNDRNICNLVEAKRIGHIVGISSCLFGRKYSVQLVVDERIF